MADNAPPRADGRLVRRGAQRQRAPRHDPSHRPRMRQGQRYWIYCIVGALWVSGAVWLLLDRFFSTRGEFGPMPHPLAAPLLLLHGILAVLSMYLFGWVMARHVLRWWAVRRRRISGSVLTAFLGLLSVSGFALFFLVDDGSLHAAALIHDVLGLAAGIAAIQHWFFRGRQAVPPP